MTTHVTHASAIRLVTTMEELVDHSSPVMGPAKLYDSGSPHVPELPPSKHIGTMVGWVW